MTNAPQTQTRSPHQRRREQVYAILNQAPEGATYSQLIELVRSQTGKGCSRKLISRWKRENRREDGQVRGPVNGCDSISANTADNCEPISANTVDRYDAIKPKSPNVIPFKRPVPSKRSQVPRRGNTYIPPPVNYQPPAKKSPNLIGRLLIAISLTLGCGWLLFNEDLPPLPQLELLALTGGAPSASARQPELSQKSKVKSQNPPIPKPKSIEPRSLKITLNVTKPEHIRVKPGDAIIKGQIIADRPEERTAILAKKTQLEIAIKQATLGLADPPPPAPNFQAQEQALRQRQTAIETQSLDPGFQFKDREMQEIFEPEKIAQENQAKQRQLEKSAEIEVSLAKLQEAKAQYQQQLFQYQQQRQRQRYELNSLQAQLAQVEGELQQVEAVRSPYSGTVKKVKVKGQMGNQMEVEVTVLPKN